MNLTGRPRGIIGLESTRLVGYWLGQTTGSLTSGSSWMLKKCFFLFLIEKVKKSREQKFFGVCWAEMSSMVTIINIMRGKKQAESVNSDLPQDEDQEAELLGKYRREASEIIGRVDVESDGGRQVLATSYRRIHRMLDGLGGDRFNLSEEPDQLQDVLKCAFFYRAYDLSNPNQKYLASFCKEAVNGNRRLKVPSIQIEDEIININQKTVRLNSNKQEFSIKIEAEPSAGILYTNVPQSHPLLVDPRNLKHPYFRKYGQKQVLDILIPPCEISIIAVSDSKIESKVISLKVTAQINEGEHRQMNMGYAVRPAETFPFEESAFGSSQSASIYSVQEYMHDESGND